ncbi:MAG TPA: glycosyltransferase, partial [Kofleriaceae bacterium]|nr:glycosyltransferase [Kofleriaceae bacterium]
MTLHVLVATVPLTGHVRPMAMIVRALVDRGHRVTWTGARAFAGAIEAAGARFVPPREAPDVDDARLAEQVAGLRGTRGLARVRAELHGLFLAPMVAQLHDLQALAAGDPPDLLLADQAHLGAALLAETTGLPWVGLGVSALGVRSRDTAPFGVARRPPRHAFARALDRLLAWTIDHVLFRSIHRAYRAGRVAAGLAAGDAGYFDLLASDLYLQPTVEAFEYPRRDLPPQVRFIGPLVPPPVEAVALPRWWPDVDATRAAGRPIVLVTQGTMATDPRELIVPALRALAAEELLVVATTPPETLGVEVPANARVARHVPYQALLAHARLMITNGGYGGVQMALAHGVPLVVAGGSEEKPEIAARVAWSGAGVDLRTGRPRARTIARAVRRVLGEPAFARRAGE